jgi:hypothetical protein
VYATIVYVFFSLACLRSADPPKRSADVPTFGGPLDKLLEADRKAFPHLKVPRLLEQAVDYLLLHGTRSRISVRLSITTSWLSGISTEGLFRVAGTQDDIRVLKQEWNSGTPLLIQFFFFLFLSSFID